MNGEIKFSEQVLIKEADKDEYWLQDVIFKNPICLGLGELDAIGKEKKQSSGGRLDILLEDPEDGSRYEVEVMLGETDETHIIRTIEYWARERRKYPLRQHYAVIVAEQINRRFFEVIYLLSETIPIIAIQASLRKTDDIMSLGFDKILDIYEETTDGQDDAIAYTREYWQKKSDWTIANAEALKDIVTSVFGDITLNYVKNYISLNVQGKNFMWLHKRGSGRSLMGFRVQVNLADEVSALLDEVGLSYTKKKQRVFHLTVDKSLLTKHSDTFMKVAEFIADTSTKA